MQQFDSSIQKIGIFFLAITFGSCLDWIFMVPYIQNYLSVDPAYYVDNMNLVTCFALMAINLGMITRILLQSFLIKLKLLWAVVLLYPIFWIILAYCENAQPLIVIVPLITSFLIGLIILDPIERCINLSEQNREFNVIVTLSGVGLGYLIFMIIIQFSFNPTLLSYRPKTQDENQQTLEENQLAIKQDFKMGCYVVAICTLFTGVLGASLQSIPTEQERIKEYELSQSKFFENIDNQGFQFKTNSPLTALKTREFWLIWIQLFLMNNCSIGSMNYISSQNTEESKYFYYALICGTSFFIGQLLPVFLQTPLNQKLAFGFIQILQLLSVNFLSFTFDKNDAMSVSKLISFMVASGLFGGICSVGVLALSAIFEWKRIFILYPFLFTSISFSSFVIQYADNLIDNQLVFLINMICVLIAFLINIFGVDQQM